MTSGPQDPQPGGPDQQPPYGQQPPPWQPAHGQQNPYEQPTHGQQPPYGQPAPGQQFPYGQQYGQQPGYGQSPYGQQGWGYPAAPGQQRQLLPPTPRPATVKAGIAVFVLNVLLGLISSVLSFANWDETLDRAADRASVDPDSFRDAAQVGAVIGAVIGVLFLVGYLVVLWFAWTGRNWARITLWVLAGLSLLFGLVGLIVGSSLDAGGNAVLTVLGLLLQAAGIVLLAMRPSSAWYRAEGQRRARY